MLFLIAFIYVNLCLLVALLGWKRKFGFWGYFFCSIALTPWMGLLFVLASGKRVPAPVRHD